jgi:hypothetical protein
MAFKFHEIQTKQKKRKSNQTNLETKKTNTNPVNSKGNKRTIQVKF